MGVLKVRVGGAWQALGSAGGPLPAGGVLGDILVKQSATLSDALWTTTMPKLALTSEVTADIASTGHALTVGLPSGNNLAMGATRIQARNNSAIQAMHLNPMGGRVVVGSADPAQYPAGLQIGESIHATSRRAYMKIGAGWEVGQDFSANGTKDFFIYNVTGNRAAMTVDSTGRIFSFGDGIANTDIYLAGIQMTGNLATSPRLSSDGAYINLHAKTDAYIDGNIINFRSASYVAQGKLEGGMLTLNGAEYLRSTVVTGYQTWYNGSTRIGYLQGNAAGLLLNSESGGLTLTSNGQLLMNTTALNISGNTIYWAGGGTNGGGWIQDSTLYFARYGGGWYMGDTVYIRAYAGKQIYTDGKVAGGQGMWVGAGSPIRFNGESDANHSIQYSNEAGAAIDPGSGVASNGPKIRGYTTVWMQSVSTGLSFLFDGACFINSSRGYNKFSSRTIKEHIEPLDVNECLDQVMRWQPVEYDMIDDPDLHREGFIAEDLHAVTPLAVSVTGPDADKPNWPNAIDYGALTTRLTGAVQALAARIEQLEGKSV